MSNPEREQSRALRPEDVVEVRSAAEILATLDDKASRDNLPFMPEMAHLVGKRFTVSRRVDKICDTITYTGSRRMHETVYLEDLRCNGSGHDGCQAGCKIYWKEAWLRRIDDSPPPAVDSGRDAEKLAQLAKTGARAAGDVDGRPAEVWRCQATEAVRASTHLRGFDVGQYWRELTNGNYRPLQFLRLLVRAIILEAGSRVGVAKQLPLRGASAQGTARPSLNLRPGELVEVRSPSEIAATLDEKGLDRGLSFDREMVPFCGQTLRVKDRVEKIVDDKSGRMLRIRRDCLILEGAVCSGVNSFNCWFCPREIHCYWRESWVRRVGDQEPPQSVPPP